MSSTQSRQHYKQSPLYEKLVKDHDIFPNNIDCFVFAAAVGFAENRIDPDDYTGDGEMLWMHFSNRDLYRAAAAAMAYQHTGDPKALTDPDIQLEVMAQYAAGGAAFLEERFGEMNETPRDGLLNYIQSHSSTDERNEANQMLEKIAQSFDESMYSD